MKICSKCKIEKEEVDFTPSQFKKKSGWCKACVSIYNKKWSQENSGKIKEKNRKYYQNNTEKVTIRSKKWREKNPEKVKTNHKKYYQNNVEKVKENTKKWRKENPEKLKENNRKWYQNNIEKVAANTKRWAQSNSEKVKEKDKKWKKANRERINTNQRERYQNDPVFRNRVIASGMVRRILKSQGYSKNGESSLDYFTWTSEEYELHIESLFEPWMNWKNQGKYDPKTHHLLEKRTWQLDHIIPQSDLPYKTMDHPNFFECWNLSNLRPLDAKQNIIDGATRIRHSKKENKS